MRVPFWDQKFLEYTQSPSNSCSSCGTACLSESSPTHCLVIWCLCNFCLNAFMAPGSGLSKWRSWLFFCGLLQAENLYQKKILKVWNCHAKDERSLFFVLLSLKNFLHVDSRCEYRNIPRMKCSAVAFDSVPRFEVWTPEKLSKLRQLCGKLHHDINPPRIEKCIPNPLLVETWGNNINIHFNNKLLSVPKDL